MGEVIERLREELSVRSGDLFMLRCAVEAGDPKAELLVRIGDMKRETDEALRLSNTDEVVL